MDNQSIESFVYQNIIYSVTFIASRNSEANEENVNFDITVSTC